MKNKNSIKRPSYLKLFETGELEERNLLAWEGMKKCCFCPHNCKVDRTGGGSRGFCRTGKNAVINSFGAHYGEESVLSGKKGSGTIFISHCNMSCVFCQNWEISNNRNGVPVSAPYIASAMLSLQADGCHNINLVSPSHIIPHFLSALLIAADKGLDIPIVYNSGGFDSVSSLKLLDGIVDIYMPDMKYGNSDMAFRFSKINKYVEINQAAVLEMHRQVGDLKTDENGIAYRGLLVRHLVMPGMLDETEKILRFISDKISKNTYINLLSQYRPCYKANNHPAINRSLSVSEFLSAKKTAADYGLHRLDK